MISTYGNDLHIYAGNWRYNNVASTENHSISFYTSQIGSTNWNTAKMYLNHYGNLGIGTTNPTERLSVNGNIRAKKLIISQQNWSDYVFDKDYKLRPLNELEKFIQQYQHLPDVPSTKEVQSKGINVGDTQALLLKKIEELTLYVIELKKENLTQQQEINDLKKKVSTLERANSAILFVLLFKDTTGKYFTYKQSFEEIKKEAFVLMDLDKDAYDAVVAAFKMKKESDSEKEARKKARVQIALTTLSYSEKEAAINIFNELEGNASFHT